MPVKPAGIIRSLFDWCPDANSAKTEPGCGFTASFCTISPKVSDGGVSGSDRPANPWDLRYEHTQAGYLLMGAIGGTSLILLVLLVLLGPEPVPLIVLALMIFVLAIMSRLTVSVSDDTLRIRFGPVGLIRKEWPLGEIVSATAVTNPWYYGYGLRWTPHGPLYNVSGRHAVEILLQSGKKIRIGTDEPGELAGAITNAIR